ncbi:MAG: hypothetical protein KBG28_13430 [Kofleriaceae bacterium]|nr:hypothetical protein [Kofleriaceae bacterium]
MNHRRHIVATISCLSLAAATLAADLRPAQAQPAPPADPDDGGEAAAMPAEEPAVTTAAPAPPPPRSDVSDGEPAPAAPEAKKFGGFVLASEDEAYQLRLTGRVQAYFGGTSTPGASRVNSGAFEIHRARLGAEGQLGSDKLTFKTQTEFGRGLVHLKDFMIDLKLAPAVWLRAGQYKRPFSRQQITSSGKLELVERGITDRAFGAGRDIGIALRNDYEKSVPIEWTVGLFNGGTDRPAVSGDVTVDPMTGEGEVSGTLSNAVATWKPVLVGRVGINHGKLKGYSEADLEGGATRVGIASSIALEFDGDRNSAASHKAELDFVVKSQGFATTGAVYFASTGTGFASDQAASLFGAHLQANYVTGGKHGVGLRYAVVAGIGDNDADPVHEILGGYSLYSSRGHDGKIQVDVGARKNGEAKLSDDLRLQVQGQIAF